MLADLSERPRTMPESHEVVEAGAEEAEEEEEDADTDGSEDGEVDGERFMSAITDPNRNHCR